MKKRVLIPTKVSQNNFFEKIIENSEWIYDYGNLETSIINYDVILIHWPEHLFEWKEPENSQLEYLEQKFFNWKQHVKIVYVVHNERPHVGMTSNFDKLYQLVLTNCDAMIHLGFNSLNRYQKTYSAKQHIVIPHPLYEEPFKVSNKIEARKQLGIKQNKRILLAAGAIRNLEERALVLNAFKSLKIKRKFLMAPRMFKKEVQLKFPGRLILKKIIDVNKIIQNFHDGYYNSSFYFNYKFLNYKELSLLISAADIIVIPRIDTLNSGNIFLAMTFNKVVIGPDIGNISEYLKEFNLPTFDPKKDKSLVEAIEEGFNLAENNFEYSVESLKKYSSKNIAKQWDDFMYWIVNN